MRRWTVGELARATGVTVRTLHHYDRIGLLSAARRSGAGYREYTETDIARLQQILSLRSLGLSLEEIREVEAEWPRLMAEVRAEMERGTDRADERVQALARRWMGSCGSSRAATWRWRAR